MMRSIAASMAGSGWSGNCGGFEFGDRFVCQLELVDFAAMKHSHDDLEQPFVGGKVIRNGAGAAQIVGGDGVGIAHHLHIQDANSTFDQHGPISSASDRQVLGGEIVPIWETRAVINMKKQAQRPENRPMRKGEGSRKRACRSSEWPA